MSKFRTAGTVPVWGIRSNYNSLDLLVSSYSQTATSQKYNQPDGNGNTAGVSWYDPQLTATLDGATLPIPGTLHPGTAIAELATSLTLADLNTQFLDSFFPSGTYTAYVDSATETRTAGGAVTRSYSISAYAF